MGHGVAEDLVVEVTGSKHGLDGSRRDAHHSPQGHGLLWAKLCRVGHMAATEDHGRVARHRGDPLEVSVSAIDREVPDATFVLVGAPVAAP